MIGTRLRGRDRRALLIGGALVLLVIVIRTVPFAISASRATAARAQSASDRLEFSRRLILSSASMESTLVGMEEALARADAELLGAGSPARVAAELSAQLTQSARSAGLAVLSASATGDSTTGPVLVRPRVRLEALGDISGVMQFLLLLETGRGLLHIVEIAVTQPDPASPNERPEQLQLSILVEGAARGAAPVDSARTAR